ncbi:transglutaminase family protein [Polymorphobacter fuscus]|uniref:Transglutaminase family protein n=1 Tax=Sandarakinorhabdus fusca TaxID=1439888 RepID=A0A7C9KXF9_9SPHN|nr:transglutaminase family protein [Polymorphobacter fuscus]KAB7645425.1 transglutaminase family protein [Polymorphobacter fuscus]MQT17845.1 transglutaminase family protein [Polymorphobacter fuscus]NJC08474.1 transglutaminase-like putative cysteine protease [Polymorphobacter fuscus]
MIVLTIDHVTTYSYRRKVSFGEHRIMTRPRESHDQRLIDSQLVIDPPPTALRWVQDVFGNSVAIATFDTRAATLRFHSRATVEHLPLSIAEIEIEDYARCYPFTYSSEDMPDLLRSIERQHHDPARIIDSWARQFVPEAATIETMALLTAMTQAIRRDFAYVSRSEKGTQSPIETLERRQGTCRDFAVLMIEAVRALGFAARFVSGYVYSPSTRERRVGGGNTHAWVRIFLPGSGWVEFDPTNGIVGNRGLIRVGVARDPYQAVPLSGTWAGFPDSVLDMTVSVDIILQSRALDPTEGEPIPC